MSALLLKEASQRDLELINRHRIPAIFAPVFDYFTCVKHDRITSRLSVESSGWIFTSKRALNALNPYLREFHKNQAVLTVGQGCADWLSAKGIPVTACFPNAFELAAAMQSFQADSWNYFCGAIRRQEVRNYCTSHGLVLFEEVVYDCRPLTLDLSRCHFSSIWAFSSETIKAFTSQTKSRYLDVPIYCIGPTTAATGQALDFKHIITSTSPDLSGMIRLYQQLNANL